MRLGDDGEICGTMVPIKFSVYKHSLAARTSDPGAESRMRESTVRRWQRRRLTPSSIKTSQIDATAKREEESPTPARFYAITLALLSFSFVRRALPPPARLLRDAGVHERAIYEYCRGSASALSIVRFDENFTLRREL